MNVTGFILALVALVVVAVIGSRVGYLRGRAERLLQVLPTEAERNDRGFSGSPSGAGHPAEKVQDDTQ